MTSTGIFVMHFPPGQRQSHLSTDSIVLSAICHGYLGEIMEYFQFSFSSVVFFWGGRGVLKMHNLGHNYFKGCGRGTIDAVFLNSISAKMNATD